MAARAGVQVGVELYMRSKRTPSAAMRSRLGVRGPERTDPIASKRNCWAGERRGEGRRGEVEGSGADDSALGWLTCGRAAENAVRRTYVSHNENDVRARVVLSSLGREGTGVQVVRAEEKGKIRDGRAQPCPPARGGERLGGGQRWRPCPWQAPAAPQQQGAGRSRGAWWEGNAHQLPSSPHSSCSPSHVGRGLWRGCCRGANAMVVCLAQAYTHGSLVGTATGSRLSPISTPPRTSPQPQVRWSSLLSSSRPRFFHCYPQHMFQPSMVSHSSLRSSPGRDA